MAARPYVGRVPLMAKPPSGPGRAARNIPSMNMYSAARRSITVVGILVTVISARVITQSSTTPHTVPRPPAETGTPEGSIAPDGYAPIPEWAGQTRAPRPAKTETFAIETAATGISGGFSFHFLPDNRIIVSERPGRIRLIGADGKAGAPIGGLPEIWARGPQGLFEVLPDRDFATNRTIYFDYPALPQGTAAESAPRLAGVLMVARARLAADDSRLE